MQELGQALILLARGLGELISTYRSEWVFALLLFVWVAWWLWAVDWTRLWSWLRAGAWAPLVLLMLAAAMVWSQIAPSESVFLGELVLPNFWSQFFWIGLLVCLALFCGWLQGYFGWTPPTIQLDPPRSAHDAAHAPAAH